MRREVEGLKRGEGAAFCVYDGDGVHSHSLQMGGKEIGKTGWNGKRRKPCMVRGGFHVFGSEGGLYAVAIFPTRSLIPPRLACAVSVYIYPLYLG